MGGRHLLMGEAAVTLQRVRIQEGGEEWSHVCNLAPRLTNPHSVPGRYLKTDEQPREARRQTDTHCTQWVLFCPGLQRE